MRHARSAWTAFAVFTLISTSTAIRGDQSLDPNPQQASPIAEASATPADDPQMSAMGQLAAMARAGRLDRFLNRPDDAVGEPGDVVQIDDPAGEE